MFGLNDTKLIKNIFTVQAKIKYPYPNTKPLICSVRELAGGKIVALKCQQFRFF